MALVKFSAVVSEASGKIGGNVFAKNKGGAYIRSWSKPVDPNSTYQQAQRNKLASMVTCWGALSATERKQWQIAADESYRTVVNRLGETRQLSGQQLFLKQNLLYKTLNPSGMLSAPPVPKEVVTVEAVGATIDVPNEALVITSTIAAVGASRLDEAGFIVRSSGAKLPGRATAKTVQIGVAGTNAATSPGFTFTQAGGDVTISMDLDTLQSRVGNIEAGEQFVVELDVVMVDDPWSKIHQKMVVTMPVIP